MLRLEHAAKSAPAQLRQDAVLAEHEAAAAAAIEHAEKTISERKAGIEYSTALTELAEATAQLRAIQMLRKRHKSGS